MRSTSLTDQLQNLYLEGEGAGGLPTASSILSDVFEIANNVDLDQLVIILIN